MNRIAIIDVGAGNLYSVEKAVKHVADAGSQIEVTADTAIVEQASHIILPGVGAFADCMKGLQALTGMQQMLERRVLQQQTPFFGICVGMQMLFERGYEHGEHAGLGWLKGEVVSLTPNEKNAKGEVSRPSEPSASGREANKLKIPHMGWNELQIQQPHPLLEGIAEGDHAYFVHSYHCVPQEEVTVLSVDYGGPVVAAVARDSIFATQFHPEKSQKTGLRILQNFLQLPHADKN